MGCSVEGYWGELSKLASGFSFVLEVSFFFSSSLDELRPFYVVNCSLWITLTLSLLMLEGIDGVIEGAMLPEPEPSSEFRICC